MNATTPLQPRNPPRHLLLSDRWTWSTPDLLNRIKILEASAHLARKAGGEGDALATDELAMIQWILAKRAKPVAPTPSRSKYRD